MVYKTQEKAGGGLSILEVSVMQEEIEAIKGLVDKVGAKVARYLESLVKAGDFTQVSIVAEMMTGFQDVSARFLGKLNDLDSYMEASVASAKTTGEPTNITEVSLKVRGLIDQGITDTDKLFEKIGGVVGKHSIRAIKSRYTLEKNQKKAQRAPSSGAAAAKASAKKQPKGKGSKKKNVAKKKTRRMSAERKQKLLESIRKVLSRGITETDEVKKVLAKEFGFRNVNGRIIHGVRATSNGGVSSKKK